MSVADQELCDDRPGEGRSAIERTAAQLRREAMHVPVGTLLGGEEALLQRMRVSRPTLRQAARILEREGLLRVRRGNNGGYIAARPDGAFVEAAVASYLEALGAEPQGLMRIATAVWIEAVAKACAMPVQRPPGERSAPDAIRGRLRDIAADAGFDRIMKIEEQVRRFVFDRAGTPYVELIFNINANFARRGIMAPAARLDGTPEHGAFVARWRTAILLLLDAIDDGDGEVAAIAAARGRRLLQQRIWPDDR